MSTPFDAPDWRGMSQEDRDLGLNNSVAVPGSADMVAGWERRSADLRARHPGHLDLRYGPRERNRIDFLKAADGGADASVHPWRLLADARQGSLHGHGRRPDGARHQRRPDRLHAGAGGDAG